MIMTANSLSREGSGAPQSKNRCSPHTKRVLIGLPHVRTGLGRGRRIFGFAPQPVQTHRQSARHGGDGDIALPPHGQMDETPPPPGIAAHRCLGRLYQQVTQQRVALLAEMSQTLLPGAGIFAGNQSQITAHLFAAAETIGVPSTNTKASAVIGPTPGWVIKRCTSGRCCASCSIAWLSSAICGVN